MDFRSLIEFIKDVSKYIIVIVIVLLIFIFVIGLQQVVGTSMSPTLEEGNIVVVNKLLYRFSDIKRKDIVILSQDEKYMIKRVIGLPGEVVKYENNNLYINGISYEESYLNKEEVITENFSTNDLGYEVIPEDMYLVLGDNREDSVDSRSFGLVSKKNIIGKVWFSIWPFNTLEIVK